VDGFHQNHWSACIRMSGRLASESLVGFRQITQN
jgi:hypothetical protein